MTDWMHLLREQRNALHLSRNELALRTGVSSETVKAYELGRRTPSQSMLVKLLDEMRVDRVIRNKILAGAGFAPDGADLAPGRDQSYWYTLDEATTDIAHRPWPAHLNSEMIEVLAANELMQRVWNVDMETEFTGPHERNMLTVASRPRFADRILNWEEMVTTGIAVMKGHHRGAETAPEGSSPYFVSVMQHFLQGDARYISRFIDLWQSTEPQYPKIPWSYPVVWDHLEVGILRFDVIVTTANDIDGFTFCDWMPLDSSTWERLEALRRVD